MIELSIKPYINLEKQHFEDEVKIQLKKSDFENVAFREGKVPLYVSNCFFRKITVENTEEIDFKDVSLMFNNCYIENIQIEGIVSKNISLLLFNSIVSGRLESDTLRSVECSNCCLMNSLFFINIKTINVRFSESYTKLHEQQHFKDHLENFEKIVTNKQSYYFNSIQTIWVSSEIKHGNIIDIGNLHLTLTFDSEKQTSNTTVKDIVLCSCSLTGSTNGKVAMENVKVDRLYLRNFSPKGDVAFYHIRPINPLNVNATADDETQVEIHECNLDNTGFDNVSFESYNIVSPYRTRFSKTIFTACNFPKNYASFERFRALENVHYKDVKSENYHKDQYEIFLQLKKSLESSGNYYEAQKLQGIAHDALKQIKSISCWDRFILKINSFTNNHGLSVTRPFVLFFVFTVPLYIAYLWSLGRINSNNIDYTLFGAYFSFIDLTHRTDFLVNKDEFTGLSLALDFINKVIAGFFIYQMIAAFRKYGKN